jgi:hypothetical protein
MNCFDIYSSYPDRTIAAAWDSQVKEADQTPWLANTLTECGGELFARFAETYADLRALPRGARRSLQRQLARSAELPAIWPDYLQQGARRLHRRMAWSLAGAALLLALGQGVATAATITVTTNDPRIIADGQCSLIEAIINANNDAATHADCPAGSGADTIVLPASANLTLSAVDNTTFGPTGLPVITSRITIEGNGATIARQVKAPSFSLMVVTGSGDLTLHHLTLSRSYFYAGLRNYGTASIKDSVISGNISGVFNRGTLTIENSSISANTGLFYYYAGGGVTNSGTLTIENSTISGNRSRYGGGVVNSDTLTIVNSTISGNTGYFSGGGVTNYSGTLTIENSTISGNTSFQSSGGGVRNYGSVTFTHTLIAGNQAAASPEIQNDGRNCSGIPSRCRVIANNFNLFGTNGNAGVTGFTPGPTDIVPSVSLANILGPLRNNGGPTQTHALLAGSPAIDGGNPNGCRDSQGALLTTDQRGFARHVDGNNDGTVRCDIGAVELNRLDFPFTLVAAVLPSSRSVPVGTPATAFATIINTDSNTATGCAISPITSIPATLTYQTTNPATNQVTNSPNTPVDIPAGAAQSFVFALTPTAPIAPTDVQLSFDCANTDPALIISGLNTFFFSASSSPIPDMMALVATLSNDGIVNIPGINGTGVFAVATVNMGAGDNLSISADTGGAILPVTISICQTDPQSGACFSPPASSVITTILSNETPTFGLFVAAAGNVLFDPGTNRIFVRFKDSDNVTRGSTSVAVRTQ